jgi:hypothetical protein
MTTQERINIMRGIDEQLGTRNESNMFNLVNQKSPKINMGERK